MLLLRHILSETYGIGKGLKTGVLILSLLICVNVLSTARADENADFPLLEVNYIGQNVIYVSEKSDEKPPIKNELTFYMKSVGSPSDRGPADIPAKANNSYIKIFFEYGDGLGDLARKEDAGAFELSMIRNYDNKFEIKKFPHGAKPYWLLTATSKIFLNGGNKNRIELKFSNIYSYLNLGITTMHIEYGHKKDTPAGCVSLDIVKSRPAEMQAKYGLYASNLNVSGTVKLQAGGTVNMISNDMTLKKISDQALPTEKAVKTYVDNRLPGGVIVMWSGAVDKIPPGWALCDGRNGTPDLRDRFIAMAGRKYKVGEQGGSDSVTLTADQMPAHNHGGGTGGKNLGLNYRGVVFRSQGMSEGILVHFKEQKDWKGNRPNLLETRKKQPIQILPQNHSHTIAAQGGGKAHENRPQFYALAFIVKLP